MRIIKDPERQLNIHPFVVYFVLSPQLIEEYGSTIKQLRKYKGFTRGIFKFHVVPHIDKYSDSVLSADLKESMKRFNMMVRLMDDSTENFYYSIHQVNFDQPTERVEISIQQFIVDVCKQNLKQLDNRLQFYSDSSERSLRRQVLIKKIKTRIEQAIALKQYRHNVWNILRGGNADWEQMHKEYCIAAESISPKKVPTRAIDKLREEGFSEEEAKRAANALWEMVESEFDLPSKRTSDAIASGTLNRKSSLYIVRDQRIRIKPKTEPAVSVEIKKIPIRTLKSGKEKKEWSVEFNINGESFPIHFGLRESTMLYVCTLLRRKMGEDLYIHEFYNNSKGRESKFSRNNSKQWFKAVYDIIFPSLDKGFNEWINHIENCKGRPLNQGKGHVNRQLDSKLANQPDGIYYCVLNTKNDWQGDSFYRIEIKPEDIIVPQELSLAISSYNNIIQE